MPSVRPGLGAALLAFTALGLGSVAVVALDSSRLLSRGVDVAFGNAPGVSGAHAAVKLSEGFDPTALRLSAWQAGHPSIGAGLKVGDRITLSSGGETPVVLEVVERRPVDPAVTRIDSGTDARFLLITSRVVGEPKRLMQFLVETGEPETGKPSDAHRAL